MSDGFLAGTALVLGISRIVRGTLFLRMRRYMEANSPYASRQVIALDLCMGAALVVPAAMWLFGMGSMWWVGVGFFVLVMLKIAEVLVARMVKS